MLGVIHNYCHAEIKDGAPNCRRQQAGISMDEVYSGSVAETRKHNGGNGEPRQMTRLRPNQRVDLNTS